MFQAAFLDCQFFDLSPFCDDVLISPQVNIRRGDVSKALVISLVVVIIDEGSDLLLKLARHVIIFQQHTVFHGLVPAFDFTLRLWMERRTAYMVYFLLFQPLGQIARYITRTIIAEQARFVAYNSLIAKANSMVSVTSLARMVVHSFHEIMWRL